ncbi:3-oxoacyl-[acyl-carrier-protein] reductase FabG-like [Ostrinia nubilalis]|uniref:3-oxoacyl-[acyl-carrier-protein] reductase FabG-like n=1 Tax=Ostrinia nubilalis TaxID=29057 RepID=UPI00308260B7
MVFNNKVVIITGASSGIGAACAVLFAKASAKLVLVGRNFDNLTKTANMCKKFGLHPFVLVADVNIEDDLKKIVDETVQHFGRIDVLVNNAGFTILKEIKDGVDAFDSVMRTNLRAPYLLTSLALPYLIKTKGNVVNISSILAYRPLATMTAYCMSKAALDMFTKCAAIEFGPHGVRVNSVNPGPVKTQMFKFAGLNEETVEMFFSNMEQSAPLQKVAYGEDVAEVVLFLASDKASCVTGSCYQIDCGLSIKQT